MCRSAGPPAGHMAICPVFELIEAIINTCFLCRSEPSLAGHAAHVLKTCVQGDAEGISHVLYEAAYTWVLNTLWFLDKK